MVKKVKQNQSLQFAVINPCCAAIDVGSIMMMVSYSDEQGKEDVIDIDLFFRRIHFYIQHQLHNKK